MGKHNETGAKGEQLAEVFLLGKGYIILARNWRHQHKEVDLILLKDDWLVIAEVKTRRGTGYGFPEEAVTAGKQAFLRAAATAYFEAFPGYEKVRFDVISIVLNRQNEAVEILHLEDAF